jgi:hypothetical protein
MNNNIDKMLLCSVCCPQEQKEKIQRVVTKIKCKEISATSARE